MVNLQEDTEYRYQTDHLVFRMSSESRYCRDGFSPAEALSYQKFETLF